MLPVAILIALTLSRTATPVASVPAGSDTSFDSLIGAPSTRFT
jgi:hypothetical protein